MRSAGLAGYFPAAVRARADDYSRAVRVLESAENSIHLHVRGAADYCLHIRRLKATLFASCTCPYFDGGNPCKHLWAALQFIERTNALGGEPSPSLLRALPPESHDKPLRAPVKPTAAWRVLLGGLRDPEERRALPDGSQILYIVDLATSEARGAVVLELGARQRKPDGEWSRVRPLSIDGVPPGELDPADRAALQLLDAIVPDQQWGRGGSTSTIALRDGVAGTALALAHATGRLFVRQAEADRSALSPYTIDTGPPYIVRVAVNDENELVARGVLERDGEGIAIEEPVLLTPEGLVLFRDRVARFSTPDFRWIGLLRRGPLRVPRADGVDFAVELANQSGAPPISLPDDLRLRELSPAPRTILRLRNEAAWGPATLRAQLSFDYDGTEVEEREPRTRIAVASSRTVLVRDVAYENEASERLAELGLKRDPSYVTSQGWSLGPKLLGEVVATLTDAKWTVLLDDHGFHAPGQIDVQVSSGIDWFDLAAEVHYGELRASLPVLLAAAKRGERFVTLSDGSLGLLPEAWLEKHRLVGELGATQGDALRFKKTQVGLLDALLATLPEARVDEQLARARAMLATFSSVVGKAAPPGFIGTLRGYQESGLGWLEFLRDFGFGGCLADDMGLGKTIQVLAQLEARRGEAGRPSLVVVPKSLVFNWRREAAQFTPSLRVLEHHGTKRSLDDVGNYDLVVTTYGTLVRDAAKLCQVDFDYVILDEAQAIKNARTDAAKAARLLRANHRLALTGTPIENKLADLWSLFEFLNPGMLGASSVWKRFSEAAPDETERKMLARALRPFLLRRTKEQVAADLPEKTEQVIYCELEGDEKKQYEDLRVHYRATLLGLVEKKGIERSQLHILEALLRLRQAACHPALLDVARTDEPSAKLTALLGQLDDVVAGGHKAVVFSQFTSLLAIVRAHLDKAGVKYESLDGKTRNRQARVDRFQTDPDCSVFLVSLKAGGVGLNLTAAEYVFLLDPWWNPAVEAQAIDRAHRIGQTKPVIAYRLIGKGTIEEKVLELQRQKKLLADAIVNDSDSGVVGRIGREDLELLLS